MRVLSIALWLLGATATVAWAVGFLYVQSMACAFSGPAGSQGCSIRPPWSMNLEDLTILVILPGTVCAVLLTLAVWATVASRGEAASTDEGHTPV